MEELDFQLIKEELLFKKVVEWNKEEDYIVLDDGTKVEVYCSDFDCCAWASGSFTNVELDAVITDVDYKVIRDGEWDGYSETTSSEATLTLFHNQNIIAQNEVYADAGNCGYYYSTASLKIGNISIPILDA